MQADPIPAFTPRGGVGVRFVQCADVLGGVPGRDDERLFRQLGTIVRRFDPQPQFLLFNGDHVAGYAPASEVRREWRYFLDRELASWLQGFCAPVFHLPGNHDVVSLPESIVHSCRRSFPNPEAEAFYREAFPGLPANGPPGQEGLAWYHADKDYLLVALHPIWSGRGATGFDEAEWLDGVLRRHGDRPVRMVASHFPVFPVNGYDRHAPYPHASWIIAPEQGRLLWDILVEHRVSAYLCAHVCGFDLQVHRGIPQVCSAGGGHSKLYPPYAEYHHVAQAALDEAGCRVQAVDLSGAVRECWEWPTGGPAVLAGGHGPEREGYIELSESALGEAAKRIAAGGTEERTEEGRQLRLRFSGTAAYGRVGEDQTLAVGWDNEIGPPLLWVGIPAGKRSLAVKALLFPEGSIIPWPAWFEGPELDGEFDIDLLFDPAMGPGGLLFTDRHGSGWSSLATASPFGFACWRHPPLWHIGRYQNRFPFRGGSLRVWNVV